MATASATEFPDDDKISDTYRTAAEVLNKLNVFAGDQNGNFNPTDPIRRSEVAAILSYREDGLTLGMENFGLEGIEGVVTPTSGPTSMTILPPSPAWP